MFPRKTAIALIFASGCLISQAASACGFENPALMAKGMLNWIYPKSVHVDTAVWQAQRDGVLAREEVLPASKMLLVNPGYRRAVTTLQEFAFRTGLRSPGGERQAVTILLMEAVLYSRITYGKGRARLEPHVSGGVPGQPVMVTHRIVLEALNAGKVTPEAALSRGLVRVYGDDAAQDEVLATLRRTYSLAGASASPTDSVRR